MNNTICQTIDINKTRNESSLTQNYHTVFKFTTIKTHTFTEIYQSLYRLDYFPAKKRDRSRPVFEVALRKNARNLSTTSFRTYVRGRMLTLRMCTTISARNNLRPPHQAQPYRTPPPHTPLLHFTDGMLLSC